MSSSSSASNGNSGPRSDQTSVLQYAQRLKLLYQTGLGILSPQSLQDTVQSTLDHIREIIPCQRASISLYESDGSASLLAVSADRTQHGAGSTAPPGSVDVQALRQGKPNLVQDITPLVASSPVYRRLQEEGIGAHVSIPLIAQGELLGSFNIGRSQPGSFTPEDIEIAGELSAGIALAILHKRQEQAMAESEATYRVMFEAVSDGIAIHEVPSGKIIDCNDRLCEMAGYTKAEFFAQSGPDGALWDEVYTLERALDMVKLAAAGEPQLFQWRTPTKSGGESWCEVTLRRAVLNGKIRVLAVIRDIAERKANENELRTQRDLVENLLETAPALIVVLTPDGIIARANRYTQQVTGHSIESLQGNDPYGFMPPEYREQAKELITHLLQGQSLEGVEIPFLAKDANPLLISWNGSPLRDPAGRIVGIMFVGQDMTALRQKEIQVQQMQKLEAVGRLAGGVAHDFNNQLTVIKGYCELLLRGHLPAEMLQSSLEEIYKAALRSAALVSDLLVYSGRQNLRPRITRLEAIIKDMEPRIRSLAEPDVQLQLQLPERLSPVFIDANHAQQAILNLCSNARDAMPAGGVLEISLTEIDGEVPPKAATPTKALTGPRIRLTVRDSGQGMDTDVLGRIFDPFFTTKPPGKGTGLGLAMVHSFVEQSGGSIFVDSHIDHGTTFTIDLPRAQDKLD